MEWIMVIGDLPLKGRLVGLDRHFNCGLTGFRVIYY